MIVLLAVGFISSLAFTFTDVSWTRYVAIPTMCLGLVAGVWYFIEFGNKGGDYNGKE